MRKYKVSNGISFVIYSGLDKACQKIVFDWPELDKMPWKWHNKLSHIRLNPCCRELNRHLNLAGLKIMSWA
jgi:hypothetical protein